MLEFAERGHLMAYLMENVITTMWQVAFDWADPDAWLSRLDNSGEPRPLRRDQVPTMATFTAGRAKLPDFALVQAWMVISHRLRCHIATLEPHRNQYFAFDVARKNGKPVLGPDGKPHRDPYYLIDTTTRFDAILLQQSVIDPRTSRHGLVFPRGDKIGEIVLDRNMIAGHHVWEGINHMPGKRLISNELGDWIIANQMKGVELTKLREAVR